MMNWLDNPLPLSQVRAVPLSVQLHPEEISFAELGKAEARYAETKAHYQRLCNLAGSAESRERCWNSLGDIKSRVQALREALVEQFQTPELLPLQITVARFEDLVAGCLGNRDIQEYMRDDQYRKFWVRERIAKNPTLRVEYEYTTVISTVGEAIGVGKHKRWGRVYEIVPLGVDDPVHPTRMLFIFKDSNPYNQRYEQREAMRAMLPPWHRKLVSRAMRDTKALFLQELTDCEITAIREGLKMEPGDFWRAAIGAGRGTLCIPRQVMMFDFKDLKRDPGNS